MNTNLINNTSKDQTVLPAELHKSNSPPLQFQKDAL